MKTLKQKNEFLYFALRNKKLRIALSIIEDAERHGRGSEVG